MSSHTTPETAPTCKPRTLRQHAQALVYAGAAMVVFELMPWAVAADIARGLPVSTIGIGAGVECSGQGLVLPGMPGLTGGKLPRFVKNFMQGATSIDEAIKTYVADVKAKRFPDRTLHGY